MSPAGPGGGFRVEVDRGLCQGHGVCESEAPAVFSVSKKNDLTILDPTPPAEQRGPVELAVKYCPTRALQIVDVDDQDDRDDREGEGR